MKKKITTVLAILMMLVMVTGCGQKSSTTEKKTEKQTEKKTEKQTEKVTEDNNQPTSEEITDLPMEPETEAQLSAREQSELEYKELCKETLQYSDKDDNFKYDVYETWVEVTNIISSSQAGVIPETFDNLPVKSVKLQLQGTYMSELTLPETIIHFYYYNWYGFSFYNKISHITFEGDIDKIYFSDGFNMQISSFDKETIEVMLNSFLDKKEIYATFGVEPGTNIVFPEGYEKIKLEITNDAQANIVIPETCREIEIISSGYYRKSVAEISIPKSVEIIKQCDAKKIITYKGSAAVKYANDHHIECEILDK